MKSCMYNTLFIIKEIYTVYIYIQYKHSIILLLCVFFPLRSSSTLSKPFRHASGPASLGPESPGLNSRLGEYES